MVSSDDDDAIASCQLSVVSYVIGNEWMLFVT